LRIDAIAPLLGAIVGASLNVSEEFLGHVLALYAGFFIYLGATDLLPEAHQHASWTRVGLTITGFVLIFAGRGSRGSERAQAEAGTRASVPRRAFSTSQAAPTAIIAKLSS
jgi:hypothetical protein